MRNVSVTRREDEFAKKTQVMLLARWSADDVTAVEYLVSIKLEALLGVTRGKRCLKFTVEFPTWPR